MKINFFGDVRPYMRRIILCLTVFTLLFPLGAFGSEITAIDARLANDELIVAAGLTPDDKNLDDLKKGVSKEITIYIDLFRSWKTWPDEFVSGKKYIQVLKADPVKEEYVATSSDGTTAIKKRFKDIVSMLQWALHVKGVKLASIRDLEPADYFVRVTVESRIRRLPPVIGYLLFFVPEREFRITKDSPPFAIGKAR